VVITQTKGFSQGGALTGRSWKGVNRYELALAIAKKQDKQYNKKQEDSRIYGHVA